MRISTTRSWFQAPLALVLTGTFLASALSAAPPIPPQQMPSAGGGTGTPPPRPGNGTGSGSGLIVGDQEFVQIAPGYLLYAEKFVFADTNMKSGRATGHVYIQLPPNFALLGVTFVHADSADFDVRMGWMILRGWPEVLVGSTIHRASDQSTRMRLTWLGNARGLTTIGPETLQTLRPGDIKGKIDDSTTTAP